MMKKQFLSLILALAMLLCIGVVSASAETEVAASHSTVDIDLPDNNELFAGYVEQQFYAGLYGDISMFSTGSRTAGSQLTGDAKILYDALVPYIRNIANGSRTNTHIGFGTEINVTINGTPTTLVPDQALTFEGADFTKAQFDQVVSALLVDLPYEMYWFDKEAGFSSIDVPSGGEIVHLYIEFRVAAAYQGSNSLTTDASKTTAAASAAANAQAIVADNAGKSDYDKLLAYKNYICDKVDYNFAAVEPDYTDGYGDPWQMIYVFDENDSTKVVCEGYSKAFQYLCDMTDWEGDVQCYTVTGTMSGGTGAGGHMWNIVTLDGNAFYLVDVTNSDKLSVGQGGELFMVGNATGSVASGYSFTIGSQTVNFTYDDETKALWGTDALTLATSNYEPPVVTYTVTFYSDPGVEYASFSKPAGYAMPFPDNEPTKTGHSFDGWVYSEGSISTTVPAKDVSFIATWSVNTYSITTDSSIANGSVFAGSSSALYGETVTLTVYPAEGYELDKLTVMMGGTPVDVNDSHQFTMPAGNVTVTVAFKKIPLPLEVSVSLNGKETDGEDDIYVGDVISATVTGGDGNPSFKWTNGSDAVLATSSSYTVDANDFFLFL